MKKGILFFLFLFLHATEFEYGRANFNIDFGILGLNKNHTEKISVFSMLQRHKNIFSSNWFYSYKISWYKSKTIKSVVDNYNNTTNSVNNFISKALPGTDSLSGNSVIPESSNSSSNSTSTNTNNQNNSENTSSSSTINNSLTPISQTLKQPLDLNVSSLTVPTIINLSNKIRGLDINFIFGRDLINKDIQDTYLSIGILGGITLPYIKSSSNSNNDYLKKSKTKIITYKIGGIVKGGYLLNSFMQVYGDFSYSYQTARVKNSELNINSKSTGNNLFYDIGMKFQLKTQKNLGWITLTPALFVTFGYRYNYWKVNSVKINGINMLNKTANISFVISQVYMGLGYDF